MSCRWPQGDPKLPGFTFCGAPIARPGLPYCIEHMRRAYLKQRKPPILQKSRLLNATLRSAGHSHHGLKAAAEAPNSKGATGSGSHGRPSLNERKACRPGQPLGKPCCNSNGRFETMQS
jgi:hypothetical protein